MQQPTIYPDVNHLLSEILTRERAILGEKLVGLYLIGSLVTGDFDDYSDVDVIAVLTDDLTDDEYAALDAMHQAMIAAYPKWDNRLEILYYSLHGLKHFRIQASPIAVISPGEPFNRKTAGKEWLMNWYMLREKGVTLYGAPPQTIVDPISHDEFVQAVKEHADAWHELIESVYDLPYQSYGMLTMCRALYTVTFKEQVSKRHAAEWVKQQMPQHAAMIDKALQWRQGEWADGTDPHETQPQVRQFVQMLANKVRAQ